MADLYGTNDQSSSLESEEMSSFLQILLHNSSSAPSSSPSTSFKAKHLPSFSSPPPPAPESASTTGLFFRSANIMSNSDCRAREGATTAGSSVMVDSTSGLNFSDPGGFFGANLKEPTINTFSSTGFSDCDAITSNSMKTNKHPAENEANDFSFDCERITEMSEVPVNSVPPPRGSKRSRAAEIHNLSEKRRRSRINEKLKALQKLIPNSNKTDKASMLDEAIEYLKQLQLQVQMLSMRNGLSLHPIYLPGSLESVQLPPTGMDFNDGNRLLTRNRGTDAFSGNQEISMQPAFDLSNQFGPSNEPIVIPPVTSITNSETLFGLEPSLHNHYGPFNPSSSSKEICGDDKLSKVQ